jgi:hypothetical protein
MPPLHRAEEVEPMIETGFRWLGYTVMAAFALWALWAVAAAVAAFLVAP